MSSPRPAHLLALVAIAVAAALAAPFGSGPVRASGDDGETPAASDDDVPDDETPPGDDAVPEPSEPPILRAQLRNGMVLLGTVSFEKLRVRTAYGELLIPLGELKEVNFGLVSAPELSDEIDAWIEKLGSGDRSERQDAIRTLVKHGAMAIPKLRAIDLKDVEVRVKQGVEKALKEIEATYDVDARPEDEVVTKRFRVAGAVIVDDLTVQTEFGPMTVPVSAVESLRTRDAPRRLEVKVPSKNNGIGNMFKSDLQVRRGEVIEIKAKGQVTYGRIRTDRSSRSGSGLTFGPTGQAQYGTYQQQFAAGSLFMKIGNNGTPRPVGDRVRFQASEEGRIFFGIALEGDPGSGEFELDVTVEPAR